MSPAIHGSPRRFEDLSHGTRSPHHFPAAIRLHHHLPHHLPDLHHWAVGLYRIAVRWFSLPNILFFWWVPAATALAAFAAWHWIESGREALPFLATIALFLLGYLGPLISNFPYLVPPSLTIWQTAAAPATHIFMLMGTLVMLPIILGYMILVYWVFGGKLREGEGYH